MKSYLIYEDASMLFGTEYQMGTQLAPLESKRTFTRNQDFYCDYCQRILLAIVVK